MATYNVDVNAQLVEQITGLGSTEVYSGYQFILTAGATIPVKHYDMEVSFTDDAVGKYIFQGAVTVATQIANGGTFALPGIYYTTTSAASVIGTAATVFDVLNS